MFWNEGGHVRLVWKTCVWNVWFYLEEADRIHHLPFSFFFLLLILKRISWIETRTVSRFPWKSLFKEVLHSTIQRCILTKKLSHSLFHSTEELQRWGPSRLHIFLSGRAKQINVWVALHLQKGATISCYRNHRCYGNKMCRFMGHGAISFPASLVRKDVDDVEERKQGTPSFPCDTIPAGHWPWLLEVKGERSGRQGHVLRVGGYR